MIDLQIKATDGSGEFYAYVAKPETDQTAPAVIVIQEIFGVNKVMRDICDNIAQSGYIAICPDLFWRQEPGVDITDKSQAEWDKAFELFNGFDIDKGVEDLVTTLNYIRENDECSGLVGSIGYCLGGKLAYLMAARSNADCSVSYYGVDIDSFLTEAENIKNPLLMHIASDDQFVSKDAQKEIRMGLEDHNYITHHTYNDCDHAFARVGGEHFDQDAARLANMRTSDFLATHLGRDA